MLAATPGNSGVSQSTAGMQGSPADGATELGSQSYVPCARLRSFRHMGAGLTAAPVRLGIPGMLDGHRAGSRTLSGSWVGPARWVAALGLTGLVLYLTLSPGKTHALARLFVLGGILRKLVGGIRTGIDRIFRGAGLAAVPIVVHHSSPVYVNG
ncbi:hypothetical protein MPL3365_230198 [Mesorhizobium plurifarium]|uniref:Uncharacterized protein n=1 Tax=Mesorhizobium plurifarium TaxID=69974 RepID=A0A090G4R1_MESPL|nr:hypothetical protein MPL3365_230198 [Mesorhizobium plurifarium]